jgi:hypothetical protein
MKRVHVLFLLLVSSSLMIASFCATANATPAPAEPARWKSYDLIVDLHNLPKSYSCDELWYKFRDVLWSLGAGPRMRILTYRCERGRGAPERSPSVQLQFALPDALTGADQRWADLQAVQRTIRLEPGHPDTLDHSDCVLLQQIKDTLLAALPARIVDYRLRCEAPARSPRFSVSIKTLIPESRGSMRTAAARQAAPAG